MIGASVLPCGICLVETWREWGRRKWHHVLESFWPPEPRPLWCHCWPGRSQCHIHLWVWRGAELSIIRRISKNPAIFTQTDECNSSNPLCASTLDFCLFQSLLHVYCMRVCMYACCLPFICTSMNPGAMMFFSQSTLWSAKPSSSKNSFSGFKILPSRTHRSSLQTQFPLKINVDSVQSPQIPSRSLCSRC